MDLLSNFATHTTGTDVNMSEYLIYYGHLLLLSSIRPPPPTIPGNFLAETDIKNYTDGDEKGL